MDKSPNSNRNPDEVLLSFADFWMICKRAKRKIAYSALFFALLLVFYRLMQPVEYQATSTFREKSKSQAGVSTSLTSILLSGSSSGNEAIMLMKSRIILERLIRKLGLQATLERNEERFPTLAAIRDNIKIEYAMLRKKQGPLLPEAPAVIAAQNVVYTDELPISIKIKFLSDELFEVTTDHSEVIGTGKLGVLFSTKEAGFILIRKAIQPLMGQEYILTLQPMYRTVQILSNKLNILMDHDDKSLLYLKCTTDQRHQSAHILNVLMFAYQEYLREEQERLLNEQMDYLKTRHEYVREQLQSMMNNHANLLSLDIAKTGYLDAKQAMEFLATTQQDYTRDIFSIDLELKRLKQQLDKKDTTFYEGHTIDQSSSTSEQNNRANNQTSPSIYNTVTEIRSLKKQADSLELALQETLLDEKNRIKEQENLSLQFAELLEVQNLTEEANEVLEGLNKGVLPNPTQQVYHDPRYMLEAWCNTLAKSEGQGYDKCLSNFVIYMENLIHLFHVHEKAIQDRLTHQQSLQREFQGIGLTTAQGLYIEYSKELSNLEAAEGKYRFVLEQMKDPAFEISSLSSVLEDSVSQNMITEARTLLLALKDQNNRSSREQERLKGELEIQKGFLSIHIDQTIRLSQLHQKMLKEKINSLQSATLGLIQQEISVLQKHLVDYVRTSIDNLSQEREVLEQHQHEMQQDMAKLPNKWISEKMIEHQTELNKKIVEEITKLVETKNITSNLEMIQSAPIDLAYPPVQPQSPRLLLFALAGACIGGLIGLISSTIQSVKTGIPLTGKNLTLAHQHVSGTLSPQYQAKESIRPLLDQDLETLRRLMAFLTDSKSSMEPMLGQTVLLLEGRGPDYAHNLAILMAKKGLKVLLMPLTFGELRTTEALPGLLQYLEGQASQPTVQHLEEYDQIPAGGITRFSIELLGSERFKDLLAKLQPQYDYILAISHVLPETSEGETLLHLFNYDVITVTDQTWKDLEQFLQIARKLNKKISFILAPSGPD